MNTITDTSEGSITQDKSPHLDPNLIELAPYTKPLAPENSVLTHQTSPTIDRSVAECENFQFSEDEMQSHHTPDDNEELKEDVFLENIHGMKNDGNQCYVLGVLQLLRSIPDFMKNLNDETLVEKDITQKPIIASLILSQNEHKVLKSGAKVHEMAHFRSTGWKHMKNGCTQIIRYSTLNMSKPIRLFKTLFCARRI